MDTKRTESSASIDQSKPLRPVVECYESEARRLRTEFIDDAMARFFIDFDLAVRRIACNISSKRFDVNCGRVAEL